MENTQFVTDTQFVPETFNEALGAAEALEASTLKPIPASVSVPDTKPESTYRCSVQSKGLCRGVELKADEAYAPPVAWLYNKIRGTEKDHTKPLTEDEIRPFVRCRLHSFGARADTYNQSVGITEMFRLKKLLGLMARWSEEFEIKSLRRERRKLEKALRGPAPAPVKAGSVSKPSCEMPKKDTPQKKGKPSGDKKRKSGGQQQGGGKGR